MTVCDASGSMDLMISYERYLGYSTQQKCQDICSVSMNNNKTEIKGNSKNFLMGLFLVTTENQFYIDVDGNKELEKEGDWQRKNICKYCNLF